MVHNLTLSCRCLCEVGPNEHSSRLHHDPGMCDAAGVLPYWLLAPPIAQTLAVLPPDFLAVAAQSQMTYAACIISFLGGLHWALAMVHQGGMCPAMV